MHTSDYGRGLRNCKSIYFNIQLKTTIQLFHTNYDHDSNDRDKGQWHDEDKLAKTLQ